MADDGVTPEQQRDFSAAVEDGKSLAYHYMATALNQGASDASAVIACCVLIHRLDPKGEHVLPFARAMLEGRGWMDEAIPVQPEEPAP